MGILYATVMRGCKNADYLEKYSWHVASILISSVKEEKPGVPFCEFAATGKMSKYCQVLQAYMQRKTGSL